MLGSQQGTAHVRPRDAAPNHKRENAMNCQPTRRISLILAALGMLVAPMALAQQDASRAPSTDRARLEPSAEDEVDRIPEIRVSREVDQLPPQIEPQPADPDFADTALIFTNMTRHTARVRCVGFNKNGRPIGRTATVIPPLGLRYVLASDLSNDADFAGQVQCASHGRIVGSAVFIGPGLTDVPVLNGTIGESRIRFPIVFHY